MADYLTTDTDLTTVADAIRTKGGTSAALEWPSGFASAIATIPTGGGGGGSAWTKVAEKSYAVSTTSSTATNIETWATGHSELWTSDKWLYIRVRDTAGKRNGYFYGSDQFFYNLNPVNETSVTSTTAALRIYTRCNSSGTFVTIANTGSTGYGVYADIIESNGNVRVRSRFNGTTSNATLTIDSTYKVEIYLLDMPDGMPLFG